jgi:hypothetical protein
VFRAAALNTAATTLCGVHSASLEEDEESTQ